MVAFLHTSLPSHYVGIWSMEKIDKKTQTLTHPSEGEKYVAKNVHIFIEYFIPKIICHRSIASWEGKNAHTHRATVIVAENMKKAIMQIFSRWYLRSNKYFFFVLILFLLAYVVSYDKHNTHKNKRSTGIRCAKPCIQKYYLITNVFASYSFLNLIPHCVLLKTIFWCISKNWQIHQIKWMVGSKHDNLCQIKFSSR